MKKLRIDKETAQMVDDLVKKTPDIQIIEMNMGLPTLKTTKLFLKGRECIAKNINDGKDLSGQPFKENNFYRFDDTPAYYNVKDQLLRAFREGGKDAMVNKYQWLLAQYEKAKALKAETK